MLLGRPAGEAEAELWRNILLQWGVRCLIKNVSVLAYMHSGADLFQVWVLRQDLEEARALLGVGEDGATTQAENGTSES